MSSTASKIRLSGIVPESIVDGPGFRYTIFTQGCPHGCPGCHNPQTHDFAGGYEEEVGTLIEAIAKEPFVSGVTFSGGEPFCQCAPLAVIAKAAHGMGKNVLSFSGYTYEQLRKKAGSEPDTLELLRSIDLLVDGPFILSRRDLTLAFRGSSNQRILKLKDGELVADVTEEY